MVIEFDCGRDVASSITTSLNCACCDSINAVANPRTDERAAIAPPPPVLRGVDVSTASTACESCCCDGDISDCDDDTIATGLARAAGVANNAYHTISYHSISRARRHEDHNDERNDLETIGKFGNR
jgi:hypothetical protein